MLSSIQFLGTIAVKPELTGIAFLHRPALVRYMQLQQISHVLRSSLDASPGSVHADAGGDDRSVLTILSPSPVTADKKWPVPGSSW